MPDYCLKQKHHFKFSKVMGQSSNLSTSSPHVLSIFFIIAFVVSTTWHLILFLTCIPQIVNDIDHLVYIGHISMEKCLFRSLVHF